LMQSQGRDADRLQLENLALYFAAQTPVQRAPASRGDPAAGEPLTAMCGGCHGAGGVSSDAATPSLAGQDALYLANAIKAYRKTRQNWGMQRYVSGLSDKDIDNIAAYYVSQKPRASDQVPSSTQELAAKCDRCHDAEPTASMSAPKMRGQDKDYLIMALRAYRDDKRESSTMHRMSYAYSNAIIESLASWYASQPAK
jgi:cytochrome c553